MADYRVASRHGVKPVDCVGDARSAIRWVRANADRLGIDPDRIAAAGGSAGGHLAGSTAFIEEFDEPGEDRAVSAAPNALLLFNPALVLAPLPGLDLAGFGTRVPAVRLGAGPEKISPAHHVKPGGPPTIIFHGSADETVPLVTAEAFAAAMKKAGNRCEVVEAEGQPHGFFNREPWRSKTLADADAFLESLGWIEADAPATAR
jgi:acetyl esterase/lipase